jgi:hypothetical protein
MVVLNVLPQLPFSGGVRDLITGILGLLATYFHLNPTQIYAPAGSTIVAETPTTTVVTKPQ